MLQNNQVKQKLRDGQVQLGILQSIPDPGITEVLGLSGFDFVMADAEHGSLSFKDMEQIARAAELTGTVPIVRVPGILSQDIGRFLDAGASGIVVPNIRNQQEVVQVVQRASYPPKGTRGVAMPRAAGYGVLGVGEWNSFANEQMMVVIEIETREALDSLDAIVETPGVDVIFMGPLDISAALGVPGEVNHPAVISARRQILAACQRAGVAAGTFAFTADQTRELAAEGFRFFLMGVDFLYMRQGCASALKAARE